MGKTASALAELLAIVLRIPTSPGGDLAMSSCKAWDSMKHIEIIMAVEEKFDISFEPEDIPLLTSQALLAQKISDLLRDRPV